MAQNGFRTEAAFPGHPRWEGLIRRESALYARADDIRSEFARDYTRILHSMAYRRLKHKTQVFFNIGNDHICTRMEHVAHVESVSGTIARYLGLNEELTRAIATGHDLGHAPFGHEGETVITELSAKHLNERFWHEKNSLHFVDDIELLEDNQRVFRNLDLTYAVRDGIICHCGEVDENGLKPRKELIDLSTITAPGEYQSATWEGCVVKLSDKIAYIGRDIEDALRLGFLEEKVKSELEAMAHANDSYALNTTVIMHNMIIDICESSSPEKGICLSDKFFRQLNELKDFNYRYIYKHERFRAFRQYAKLIIEQLFAALAELYDGSHTLDRLKRAGTLYPELIGSFEVWLSRYCDESILPEKRQKEISLSAKNRKIYGTLEQETVYVRAVLDFISGMTDRFAVSAFTELISY